MEINNLTWYEGYEELMYLIQKYEYTEIDVYHSNGFIRHFFDRLQRGLLSPEQFMQLGDVGSSFNPYAYSQLPRVDILIRLMQERDESGPTFAQDTSSSPSLVAISSLAHGLAVSHYDEKMVKKYMQDHGAHTVVIGQPVQAPRYDQKTPETKTGGNVFDHLTDPAT